MRRVVQLARQHQLFLHSHSDSDAIERQFKQDPANRADGRPAAVAWSRQLFFDARLSASGRVSCATNPRGRFRMGSAPRVGPRRIGADCATRPACWTPPSTAGWVGKAPTTRFGLRAWRHCWQTVRWRRPPPAWPSACVQMPC